MSTEMQTKVQASPAQNFMPAQTGLLQRKSALCNTPGLLKDSEQDKEKLTLQRSSVDQAGTTTVPPIVHEVLRSSGRPLDMGERAFFEPRFGHDFSRVQVHTDLHAKESAHSVNALAYTVGQDVVFGAGQYAPETMAGRKLLAHELAHVVQQRNATYPVGELMLADATWEREADAATESAVAGRPLHVAQHVAGAQLLRKTLQTDTKDTPTDAAGRRVKVTRRFTSGVCTEKPKTIKGMDTEITISHAAINLSYCRGRKRAEASSELDYSDVVRRAVKAVPNFFSSRNPQQALTRLEQSFKQALPHANIRFELQVGGIKGKVTGIGKASVEGGVSGEAEATVGGRIGTTGIEGGLTVSGGTKEGTSVGITFKFTPGAGAPEIPDCFWCKCVNPTETFSCGVHEPEKPTPPPQSQQILYMPLFFEYEKTIPRKGWEKDYEKMLGSIIERLEEGYTIERIEGRTSPEGPLKQKQKGGFENFTLAQKRAVEAKEDLQAALKQAIGNGEKGLSMRDLEPTAQPDPKLAKLKAAQSATYEVKGLAPDGYPASAELFGSVGKDVITGNVFDLLYGLGYVFGKETKFSIEQEEVLDSDLLKHLKETLKAPEKGKPDPLAEEHVIGEGLPPDVRAEVEAEIEVFRTGKRGRKTLKDRELLETIYRPLRRALIVLNPPPPKRISEEAEKIVGKWMECLPEHEAMFKEIPYDWYYEGSCRPKKYKLEKK